MNTETKMSYYQPEEKRSFDQVHTLLYTFQYEEATAQFVTTLGGNVSGGGTMQTDFSTGMTVPTNHELTQKYVEFYSGDDADLKFREVGNVLFHYPNGETMAMDLGDAQDFLIGIQIIGYDNKENNE